MNQATEPKAFRIDDIECTLPRRDEDCTLEAYQNQEEAEKLTRLKGSSPS